MTTCRSVFVSVFVPANASLARARTAHTTMIVQATARKILSFVSMLSSFSAPPVAVAFVRASPTGVFVNEAGTGPGLLCPVAVGHLLHLRPGRAHERLCHFPACG